MVFKRGFVRELRNSFVINLHILPEIGEVLKVLYYASSVHSYHKAKKFPRCSFLSVYIQYRDTEVGHDHFH
jgi:hypothetical protein